MQVAGGLTGEFAQHGLVDVPPDLEDVAQVRHRLVAFPEFGQRLPEPEPGQQFEAESGRGLAHRNDLEGGEVVLGPLGMPPPTHGTLTQPERTLHRGQGPFGQPAVATELHGAAEVKFRFGCAQQAFVFRQRDLVSAPVVDGDGRLVGVITFDDIVDVIEEEAEEDIKALGGVRGEEELSDSVWTIVRSRFPWLLANLLCALVSAWVISHFEDAIAKMVALAVLMPVVASMGGNAGTQTMTVTVRALATRELSSANAGRIIRREIFVGLLNGLVFATILGAVAALWFNVTDLGLVIALAMVTVLAAAALGGILIPLILTRLGVDPAVSSGPFVTTITDVVGFLSFLGIATLWFGLQ